jgi:hypothetical protein
MHQVMAKPPGQSASSPANEAMQSDQSGRPVLMHGIYFMSLSFGAVEPGPR